MAAAAPTILVVDDNQSTRDLLREILSDEGYAVECEGRGSAVIARVQAGGVSLVLLDWRLPDVTGAVVLQTLAEQGLAVPVVILSGEQPVTPQPAGAVAMLGKPFEIDDLLAVLAEHCPPLSRAKPDPLPPSTPGALPAR